MTASTGSSCDEQGNCLHGCVNGFTGDDCKTGEGMLIFTKETSYICAYLPMFDRYGLKVFSFALLYKCLI